MRRPHPHQQVNLSLSPGSAPVQPSASARATPPAGAAAPLAPVPAIAPRAHKLLASRAAAAAVPLPRCPPVVAVEPPHPSFVAVLAAGSLPLPPPTVEPPAARRRYGYLTGALHGGHLRMYSAIPAAARLPPPLHPATHGSAATYAPTPVVPPPAASPAARSRWILISVGASSALGAAGGARRRDAVVPLVRAPAPVPEATKGDPPAG
ncbi:hypothetical protein Vretimale_8436 [Volvox reticuliferus]|uniref:Uncharacterized protein n=1 Tax=Volvox reticuliferus TaxID=1737510 RepID=A0A8J4GAT9_9CHLO|nr:hypothetical protein Vretifemale_11837 [Volvox reticuliferus]GIM03768.1 hypothetical protein Vretimale_8436 [Volvox reticuliferus]